MTARRDGACPVSPAVAMLRPSGDAANAVLGRMPQQKMPAPASSNTLRSRVPDQLVNLKTEPRRNIVGQYPLGKLFGIEQAVGRIPRAGSVLAKGRRKQHRMDSLI